MVKLAAEMSKIGPRPKRGVAPVRKKAPRRISVQTRLPEAEYDRLCKAAIEAGRSISEETEFRLQQSFLHEDLTVAIREEVRAAIMPHSERKLQKQELCN